MKAMHQRIENIKGERELSVDNLCSIDDLSVKDIQLIFDLAGEFKRLENTQLKFLEDRVVFNVFLENSTRTRSSFELAGKCLGANVINIFGDNTSVKKGESMLDTLQTLDALGTDVIVLRTGEEGACRHLQDEVLASVINAGEGKKEHPTQALLDAFTIYDELGSVQGKTILTIGDIKHSRVYGSQEKIFLKLGAKMRVCVPERFDRSTKAQKFDDLDEALKGVDVISTLRIQLERGARKPRNFVKKYQIDKRRLGLANDKAILMHPGPVIRDNEVSSEIMTHKRCRILAQVKNGLAIRKALLYLLA